MSFLHPNMRTLIPVDDELRWPGSRVAAVRARLLDLIVERGLRAGEALPPEPELAEGLRVGRNTLREAVKSLQALGIVEIRHGSGTFIANGTLTPLAEVLVFRARHSVRTGSDEIIQLVEVREAMETGLLPRALQSITKEDLEEATAAVVEMGRLARRGEHFAEVDRQFHAVLYRSLNNVLLSQLLAAFWSAYSQLASELFDDQVDPIETAAQHRSVLEAVIAGESEKAVTSMRDHFVDIRRRAEALLRP